MKDERYSQGRDKSSIERFISEKLGVPYEDNVSLIKEFLCRFVVSVNP